jgi:hypothetical protein
MVARRLRDSFLASLLLVLAELFGCLVLAGLVYVASMLTVFDIDTLPSTGAERGQRS